MFLIDAKGKEQSFTAVVNVKVSIISAVFDKLNAVSEEFPIISDHKIRSCFVKLHGNCNSFSIITCKSHDKSLFGTLLDEY